MNTLSKNKIETSEAKFRNLISQAPVIIATFQGQSFIMETVNKVALEISGKSYEQVINKPLFESSPELDDGLNKILNDVYTTGEPFISNEIPVQLKRSGKELNSLANEQRVRTACFYLLYFALLTSANHY